MNLNVNVPNFNLTLLLPGVLELNLLGVPEGAGPGGLQVGFPMSEKGGGPLAGFLTFFSLKSLTVCF